MDFIYIFLFTTITYGIAVTRAQKCADIDTSACQLMHTSRPDLCTDPTLSRTACPRYCKLCPVECYHCNATVLDYHNCNTTAACSDGEVCMIKELKSFFDGHHEYEMKCEAKQLCDGGSDLTFTFGKRHVKSRDIIVTCCAEDLCNYPGKTEPTTASPVCYKDIVFMVDQSSRFSDSEKAALMDVLMNVVRKLDIGTTKNLVALYGYDHDRIQQRFELTDHTSQHSLLTALHREQTTNHTSTTGLPHLHAIDYLTQHVLQQRHGDRTNFPDAVVIVGTSTFSSSLHISLSERNELSQASKDVIIVSVGARWGSGLSGTNNLDVLATDQQHVVHVNHIASHEDSLADQLVSLLQQC